MNKLAIIFSTLIIFAIATIISYEIRRSFKAYEASQKEAFGDLTKTEVIKAVTQAWKPKIFQATTGWIWSGNAPEWLAQVKQGAIYRNITNEQSTNLGIQYLWDNNVLPMFNEGMKNDIGGDAWRFYWTVGTLNDMNKGIHSLNKNNPILIKALSQVQNLSATPSSGSVDVPPTSSGI